MDHKKRKGPGDEIFSIGGEPANSIATSDVTPSSGLTGLVIVCGHAICTDSRNSHEESSWLLQPFQRSDPSVGRSSEHSTFLQHISSGANYLRDRTTLLVFSGGKTKPECDTAEGFSYGQVLLHDRNLHGPGIREAILEKRVVAECWATDSYQNLLFSIIYFWEKVGRWPETITVVTHAFKQDRFLDCHAGAIRWPQNKIRVQGINPPFTKQELSQVTAFEAKCREEWLLDPYGIGETLARKRQQRRWDEHALEGVLGGIVDTRVKEQLEKLLRWDGGAEGKGIFEDSLPWDPR